MVQAAARRAVDFSKARLLDSRWWVMLWQLLDQVEDDNLVKVRYMEHAHNCSVLDYNLNQQAFEKHWDSAVKSLDDVWNRLFPWNAVEKRGDKLRQAWMNRYGDPANPETARNIQLTVDYLNGRRGIATGKGARETARRVTRSAPNKRRK